MRRKPIATYLRLKPVCEWLYDQCGLHWSQAMQLDDALFRLCCRGVTKDGMRSWQDRLKWEAERTGFVEPLSTVERDDTDDETESVNPLDMAKLIFDDEFDYDESYNTMDVDELYNPPAPPPATHTHDDQPPFSWERPFSGFMDCYYCHLEWDVLYLIPRGKAGPMPVCIKCLQHINDMREEDGKPIHLITELERRYI